MEVPSQDLVFLIGEQQVHIRVLEAENEKLRAEQDKSQVPEKPKKD